MPFELNAGEALIVEKGAARALLAGPGGVVYLTAHVRRGALQISGLRERDEGLSRAVR